MRPYLLAVLQAQVLVVSNTVDEEVINTDSLLEPNRELESTGVATQTMGCIRGEKWLNEKRRSYKRRQVTSGVYKRREMVYNNREGTTTVIDAASIF